MRETSVVANRRSPRRRLDLVHDRGCEHRLVLRERTTRPVGRRRPRRPSIMTGTLSVSSRRPQHLGLDSWGIRRSSPRPSAPLFFCLCSSPPVRWVGSSVTSATRQSRTDLFSLPLGTRSRTTGTTASVRPRARMYGWCFGRIVRMPADSTTEKRFPSKRSAVLRTRGRTPTMSLRRCSPPGSPRPIPPPMPTSLAW